MCKILGLRAQDNMPHTQDQIHTSKGVSHALNKVEALRICNRTDTPLLKANSTPTEAFGSSAVDFGRNGIHPRKPASLLQHLVWNRALWRVECSFYWGGAQSKGSFRTETPPLRKLRIRARGRRRDIVVLAHTGRDADFLNEAAAEDFQFQSHTQW